MQDDSQNPVPSPHHGVKSLTAKVEKLERLILLLDPALVHKKSKIEDLFDNERNQAKSHKLDKIYDQIVDETLTEHDHEINISKFAAVIDTVTRLIETYALPIGEIILFAFMGDYKLRLAVKIASELFSDIGMSLISSTIEHSVKNQFSKIKHDDLTTSYNYQSVKVLEEGTPLIDSVDPIEPVPEKTSKKKKAGFGKHSRSQKNQS